MIPTKKTRFSASPHHNLKELKKEKPGLPLITARMTEEHDHSFSDTFSAHTYLHILASFILNALALSLLKYGPELGPYRNCLGTWGFDKNVQELNTVTPVNHS